MMISTSNFLNPEPDTTGHKINSIKLDFAKIAFTAPTNSPFTQCQHCPAILTQEDKEVPAIKKNNKFQWTCRFCKKQNQSEQLHFAQNNYKHAIRKNLKTKITPPIILFVIDNSGSMYQSIFYNLKYGSNPQVISQTKKDLNPKFTQILAQSTLYKQQKQLAAKLQSNFTQLVKNSKYTEQEVSKISLLYAVIEHNLKLLSKKENHQHYRVGFIFFSDMIYVLKGAKQKEIPVYVQEGELCHEEWPYKKLSVDFYQYEQMFKAGRNYQKYFGDSRLHQFDVNKVAVNKVKGGGRTALGPALALAMGIISMHDQGSRIILATDSLPNYGLLSVGDAPYVYKKIGNCLQQNGATLRILKWSGDELLKTNEQQSFLQFKSAFRDHVEQIDLNLAKCKQKESLQISILSLNKLINTRAIGHSCEVNIFCDNPKVTPEKLNFDTLDYKNIRFLNSKSKCWLSLSINHKQLQQYDLLFPVITQTIIKYSDIFTKQQYLFMSYVCQRIARPTQLLNKQQDKYSQIEASLNEQLNMSNLSELCTMQLVSIYENRKKGSEEVNLDEIKTNFKYKQIELEKDIKNFNDFAFLKNQLDNAAEDQEYQQL